MAEAVGFYVHVCVVGQKCQVRPLCCSLMVEHLVGIQRQLAVWVANTLARIVYLAGPMLVYLFARTYQVFSSGYLYSGVDLLFCQWQGIARVVLLRLVIGQTGYQQPSSSKAPTLILSGSRPA